MTDEELDDLIYDLTSDQMWQVLETAELTSDQRTFLERRWLEERETETLIAMGR